jgi:hypothetical protein
LGRRQKATVHQRDLFLFNDLLLVCKVLNKRKTVGQYTLRYWTPLIGVRVEAFQVLTFLPYFIESL